MFSYVVLLTMEAAAPSGTGTQEKTVTIPAFDRTHAEEMAHGMKKMYNVNFDYKWTAVPALRLSVFDDARKMNTLTIPLRRISEFMRDIERMQDEITKPKATFKNKPVKSLKDIVEKNWPVESEHAKFASEVSDDN